MPFRTVNLPASTWPRPRCPVPLRLCCNAGRKWMLDIQDNTPLGERDRRRTVQLRSTTSHMY